ncbi:MAG: DUF63 family protein [Candidatus Micrarchaeota archaeon]|nr:DUF63 family protein [Candidatus Micrarchaeota archaeon]
MDFFQEFFVNPIWERTGYNSVNTLAYAAIALVSAYAILSILKKEKVKIDSNFILAIVPFILLGSTIRSITDAVDRGAAEASRNALFGLVGRIVDSHVYDYGYLTVTPGIYVVIGLFTLACVLIFNRKWGMARMAQFGFAVWLTQILILAPMMKYWAYGLLVLTLAFLGWAIAYFVLRKNVSLIPSLPIFAHALDGAATYVVIDIWNKLEPACYQGQRCYFEQHVLSRAIGDAGSVIFGAIGGMFLFYLIKVGISAWAVSVVSEEKNAEMKNYVLLLLLIFGLAPGVRDLLTLVVGA